MTLKLTATRGLGKTNFDHTFQMNPASDSNSENRLMINAQSEVPICPLYRAVAGRASEPAWSPMIGIATTRIRPLTEDICNEIIEAAGGRRAHPDQAERKEAQCRL